MNVTPKDETVKAQDVFDGMDIFDTLDMPKFKAYVAPPRVEVKITDEIRSLIQEQVNAAIEKLPKQEKPETKIIEKTIHEPTKVIVKELVDNSAEVIKGYEKRIKAALDDYEKSGRGMYPVVVPNSIADQTGNGGKILSTDGRVTKWVSGFSADVTVTTAGKGIVVTTPDGLHTYRLAVDNNGVFTTEQVA